MDEKEIEREEFVKGCLELESRIAGLGKEFSDRQFVSVFTTIISLICVFSENPNAALDQTIKCLQVTFESKKREYECQQSKCSQEQKNTE